MSGRAVANLEGARTDVRKLASWQAKPWLSDAFEPPVKKATCPKMYTALSGNMEKRDSGGRICRAGPEINF